MAKLSKSLFAGDPAPDFEAGDDFAQHVFAEETSTEGSPHAPTAFERLVAISERTSGEALPVSRPISAHEVEDDLDVVPGNGE
ncbi:hypothetical protein RMS29_027705 (plasmid) [Agrobacterium rosae]|uniref:Uncharacterized protein n=1 Tax=Agrobacterium rosae TaxID=1972867 RepID=A0AAW9FIA8_9HYPH|nr:MULTISPECIES: hypothetical protein [Agrobacterium]MCF1501543.1 hypothetical protein [Allorhizobium sp. Av2]MDX8321739.1 hypothetical protein [Agrobacterium sp. rho-8.1]MDX8305205.1 hypothetical protein [Agrobacterium rosae]MDX8311486.1 hypothetical protein [Agrobacterium sp. rho-13.3]MDX8316280.1 hypothetical protein [Agrobacterium rosae]